MAIRKNAFKCFEGMKETVNFNLTNKYLYNCQGNADYFLHYYNFIEKVFSDPDQNESGSEMKEDIEISFQESDTVGTRINLLKRSISTSSLVWFA